MNRRLSVIALTAAFTLLTATAVFADRSYEELTVGSTTPITGEFFTDLWGNGAADLDVRQLLHGYGLVIWDSSEGLFKTDPSVVSGLKVSVNEQGDKTFLISLYQDMSYSDGTKITAADYLFSVLLQVDPLIGQLGGAPAVLDYIAGYDAYVNAESSVFKGLRMISDYEFSLTVDHSSLPFFYELGLLDVTPAPIHVIAPGCKVTDTGEGVCITDAAGGSAEALFNEEVLRKTLLDETDGYCRHPKVVSGPYLMSSFDGQEAVFEVNPRYKGDARGLTPSIEKLTYTLVSNDTMAADLAEGKVGLINKAADATAVNALMQLSAQSDDITMSNYPRSGLSFISFCAEDSPVASASVRQALAWCFDRKQTASAYEGNLGMEVLGWYGSGQWMFSRMKDKMDSVPSYDAGDPDENLRQAVALLEQDGWVLDEQGRPFSGEEGAVRCKQTENGIAKLELKLLYPEGNRIGEILEETFVSPLAKAGVFLTMESVSPGELLQYYYGKKERDCDMLYLATNFELVFDPAKHFVREGNAEPVWGKTAIADGELYALADALRHTAAEETEDYCGKWLAFQERFAGTLPALPVYSNVYFDFYENILQDYEPAAGVTWSQAVVDAYLGDPVATDDKG